MSVLREFTKVVGRTLHISQDQTPSWASGGSVVANKLSHKFAIVASTSVYAT